jgi:O-antigen/teichoic acid export membrane protein
MSTNAQQLDLPIVAALSGAGAAGIYAGVNRWIQPMVVAIGSFTAAAAPFIAAAPRVAALKGQLLRAGWILGAAVALSIVVFVTAPWLVTSLLGSDFVDSVPVLRLLALAMLLNAFTQPLVVALQSRYLDHVAAGIVAIAVAAQLATVVMLTPAMGALGAGIGFLIGQAVALVGTVVCIAVIIRRRRSLPANSRMR